MNPQITSRQFARERGVACPVCGRELTVRKRILSNHPTYIEPGYNVIAVRGNCDACGATWDEPWVLDGYENLEQAKEDD